ncbi:MAG: hypothetical protein CSA22_04475 [Deltaproteobacteria bacterium]|nr:MAG: hypothetical protein CSA22_04475 [Deltaproteobacteria bacterium]
MKQSVLQGILSGVLLAAVLICGWATGDVDASTRPPVAYVIHTGQASDHWLAEFEAAFESAFTETGSDPIPFQYIHTRDLLMAEAALLLPPLDYPNPVWIVTDVTAWETLLTYHPASVKKGIILLTGMIYTAACVIPEPLAGHTYTITRKQGVEKMVRVIRDLHPDMETLFIITDNTRTGQMMRNLEPARSFIGTRLHFNVLDGRILTTTELINRLNGALSSTVVLLTGWERAESRIPLEQPSTTRKLIRETNAPVYSLTEIGVHLNAVGGLIPDSGQMGRDAGCICRAALDERFPLPKPGNDYAQLVFNEASLEQWQIPLSAMPRDADIQGRFNRERLESFSRPVLPVWMLVVPFFMVILLTYIRFRYVLRKKWMQSETALSSVLETHPGIFILSIDASYRVYAFNRRVADWVHQRFGVRIQRGFDMKSLAFQSDVADRIRSLLDFAMKGRRVEEIFEVPNEAGQSHWLEVYTAPVIRHDTRANGATLFMTDITQRLRDRDELREKEQKYRTILERVEEGYYEVDLSGNFTFFNDSLCRILGYEKDELLGINNRTYTASPTAAAMYRLFNDVYASSNPSTITDVEIIRKDGAVISLDLSASLISDELGRPIGFRGVVRDITAKMKAQQERQHLEAQLNQARKMEAIGTLAGGIAHDFNNTLAGILGYTELASASLEPAHPVRVKLEKVIAGCNRARELVAQLLSFSRPTPQDKLPIHMGVFVKEAVKLLRSSLPSTIELVERVENVDGKVMADPAQLQQILVNLCDNASQSMKDGGGTLEIGLTPLDVTPDMLSVFSDLNPGRHIKLTVKDTGKGMPPDVLERIFDPFFTTHAPGGVSGMGLPVVHGIVQGLRGQVRVESEQGKGTHVQVILPVFVTPERDAAAKHPTVEAETVQTGHHILFVDDEQTLVDIEKETLGQLGHQVTGCTCSEAALALFQKNPEQYDLLITDQTMPKMNGVQLAAAVKAIRPDIPVIVCSGFNDIMQKADARAAGITEFIMKPISLSDISSAIQRALQTRDN